MADVDERNGEITDAQEEEVITAAEPGRVPGKSKDTGRHDDAEYLRDTVKKQEVVAAQHEEDREQYNADGYTGPMAPYFLAVCPHDEINGCGGCRGAPLRR